MKKPNIKPNISQEIKLLYKMLNINSRKQTIDQNHFFDYKVKSTSLGNYKNGNISFTNSTK